MDDRAQSNVPAVRTTCVSLDFATKQATTIDVEDVTRSLAQGMSLWIDVEVNEPRAAFEPLKALGLVSDDVIEDALSNEPLTRLARFEDYLHLVVSGCRPDGVAFDLERADVVVGKEFVLTIHRGPVLFLSQVQRDYHADFERYAQSLSFIIYEIWDHLIDNYLSVQELMEERVERLQAQLRDEDVDNDVFGHISELGADLLHFRKILLPARTVLTDLSTKKSIFLSAATQPFLANMVGTVEHALQDLRVDRDMLTESLNLYMSMVGHRTNEVMKRLTVVSVIFLPLTFLVGVYGMNFDVLPELRWRYGYALFWALVLAIVAGLLWLLQKNRLL